MGEIYASGFNNLEKLRRAAERAYRNNLTINPVATLATVNTFASVPSHTGFSNVIPNSNGWAATPTGTVAAGSRDITVNSVSGLAVGQYIAQQTVGSAYPTVIDLGARITAINGLVVTISKPALAAGSNIYIRAAPIVYDMSGGVWSDYNGFAFVTGATTGNGLIPPTLATKGATPYVIEFETDVANVSTSTPGIQLGFNVNGGTPSKFRVAIDDVYQTTDPVSFGASPWIDIQFASAGIHKVRVELPALVIPLALYVLTGGQVWSNSQGDACRVGIMGDSFMQAGLTGSWPGRNAGMVAANLLGWKADLLSVGGTGYAKYTTNYNWSDPARYADVARRPYAGLLWWGSVNDAGLSAASVTAACLAAWRGARALQPNAPMFIFGCAVTALADQAAATVVDGAMQDAFNQLGDPLAWFHPVTADPQGAWWSTANASLYLGADNNHPSDPRGANQLGFHIANKVRGDLGMSVN